MLSLSNLINHQLVIEGFLIDDNIVYFDPVNNGFVNTRFGKYKKMVPIEGKLTFGKFYAAYSKSKDFDQKEYTEVLKAIKGQSSTLTMDKESYIKFIDRTSIYLAKIITSNNIDTIILMDSSSPLVKQLSEAINKRLPKYYKTQSFSKAIFKTPKNIKLDTMGIEIGASAMKAIQKVLDSAQNDGYFSIKEVHDVRSRKFFKDWLSLHDNFLKHVVDKNVCLIDDYVTSGETLKQASELLGNAGAKSVTGLVILKGS